MTLQRQALIVQKMIEDRNAPRRKKLLAFQHVARVFALVIVAVLCLHSERRQKNDRLTRRVNLAAQNRLLNLQEEETLQVKLERRRKGQERTVVTSCMTSSSTDSG